MIIKLKQHVAAGEREQVGAVLEQNGILFRYTELYQQHAFVLYSRPDDNLVALFRTLPQIAEVVDFTKEYMLASRAFKSEPTHFLVDGECVGGRAVNVVAGPCSIETEEQIFKVAEFLHRLGVKFIRGGAYKPRTSPYRFQGLGFEGLKLIRRAADEYGLKVVTEIIDSSLIEEIYPYADILQVGSRNMQNFYFLKQLGKIDKPILLKRGMYAKVEEWLMAAEYILSEGNEKVILCERGIRGFDSAFRNTMDVAAIPLAKELSHLPVFADPSHGTGRRDMVGPVSLASIAAGADGLVIEIHPEPPKALSDGAQSLYLEQFEQLLKQARPVAEAVGRVLDSELTTEQKQNRKICVE